MLVGASLTGCVEAGSDRHLSQDKKEAIRENTLREQASKDMNCPVSGLQIVRNDSLLSNPYSSQDFGYTNLAYEVNGCGTKRAYLLTCYLKDKEIIKLSNKTPPLINGSDLGLLTLGVVHPQNLECSTEPFIIDNNANFNGR